MIKFNIVLNDLILMVLQKKFLLFAIIAGIAGVVVGGIIFATSVMNLLH